MEKYNLKDFPSDITNHGSPDLELYFLFTYNLQYRGGSTRSYKATFLSESKNFQIRSKAIKMLSCRNFASLLDPLLQKNLVLK